MVNYAFKYAKLNDGEWLYKKYIQEKLGTEKIAFLAGAKRANSARQALIRHNISIRSIGDGLRANRRNDGFVINKEVIEGCLLGDGYLQKWNKNSNNSFPYFAKRNKYYDHIKYVAKFLFTEKWEVAIKENNEKSLGSYHTIFSLRSLTYEKLQPFYNRWYPKRNGYKKVIPEDIVITPKVLLHWFLDDGSSYLRKDRPSQKKQIQIIFCTDCFKKNNQEMLVDKLNNKFNLHFFVAKYNNGKKYWRIKLKQNEYQDFYDIIGPCPVPSMEYKWK